MIFFYKGDEALPEKLLKTAEILEDYSVNLTPSESDKTDLTPLVVITEPQQSIQSSPPKNSLLNFFKPGSSKQNNVIQESPIVVNDDTNTLYSSS